MLLLLRELLFPWPHLLLRFPPELLLYYGELLEGVFPLKKGFEVVGLEGILEQLADFLAHFDLLHIEFVSLGVGNDSCNDADELDLLLSLSVLGVDGEALTEFLHHVLEMFLVRFGQQSA